jgi:hypothetical protein
MIEPRGRDDHLADLVHEVRSSLGAIWNAVHLLAYARDEATIDQVRQRVTRQVEHLSRILDEIEARRLNGDGRAAVGPRRADGLDG